MLLYLRSHQALKALALVRQQKVEEPIVLCDEVLASKPTDEGTLNAMMLALRQLGRRMYAGLWIDARLSLHADSDTVTMFEEALKRQPQNEELAIQTFYAYVRTGNWKSGQLVRGIQVSYSIKSNHSSSARHQIEQAICPHGALPVLGRDVRCLAGTSIRFAALLVMSSVSHTCLSRPMMSLPLLPCETFSTKLRIA
jgi:hypothetical protein